VCGQFIELAAVHLFTKAIVAIDGSKFKQSTTRQELHTDQGHQRMEQWTPDRTLSDDPGSS